MTWSRTSRHHRGYGKEYVRIREEMLAQEPLCRMCRAEGRATEATIADHIIPLTAGGKTERSNY